MSGDSFISHVAKILKNKHGCEIEEIRTTSSRKVVLNCPSGFRTFAYFSGESAGSALQRVVMEYCEKKDLHGYLRGFM